MIRLIISVVLFLGAPIPAVSDDESVIGRSFYIPNTDLLTEQLLGGLPIFKNLPDECIKVDHPTGQITDNSAFLENTATFYHSLSTSTSISANLQADFTLGFSLDSSTNSISAGSRKVRGFTMNVKSEYAIDYIMNECINNQDLTDNLIQDFEQLPSQVERPWLTSFWSNYEHFLRKYNSHLVTQVTYGSSIYQHCFSDSSNQYTKQEYTIKACADFAGPTPAGKLGVKACSDVTQQDIDSVSTLKTSAKTVLRGGSLETRSSLYKSRTSELITKFLAEANVSKIPITYKLMSLWNILKLKYSGTSHMAKAINLGEYYKGYLNFDCHHIINGVELQKFEQGPDATQDYPQYHCMIAPQGCQDNDDCHYRAAWWCECRGDSCVRHETVTTNTDTTRLNPYINSGLGSAWLGCGLVGAGLRCRCKHRDYKWVETWSSANNDEYQLNKLMHEKLKSIKISLPPRTEL